MSREASGERLQAHGFGLWAESLALALLLGKGYRVLARRYRAPGGEVDLIARRGDAIVFVEVKARAQFEAAVAAISEEKRLRISKAARFWLARHGAAARFVLRGDAVFVAPWRIPRHMPAAFSLDLG